MATVPTPTIQTAGLAVPAATINSQGNLATYLAGRVESGGARKPLAALRQSVVQSLANVTDTAITFDAEDVDYDNGHSTVTNTSRYTVGTAGYYQVNYCVAFAANATGYRSAYVRLNGTTPFVSQVVVMAASTGPSAVQGFLLVHLNAGDFIEVLGTQASTAALNTFSGPSASSYMQLMWVSV